jgi:Ca2+-binding RTX toxin-like protein
VVGTSEDDVVRGTSGGDVLYGKGGADTLIGGKGKDTLVGGRGDDTIRARDGRVDSVVCGAGDDTVIADAKDVLSADCETSPAPAGGKVKVAITIVSPHSIASIVRADDRVVCGGEDRSGNYRPNYFCTVSFDSGSTVTFTAVSSRAGESFGSWGGDCAAAGTKPTCRIALDHDSNVIATFQ